MIPEVVRFVKALKVLESGTSICCFRYLPKGTVFVCKYATTSFIPIPVAKLMRSHCLHVDKPQEQTLRCAREYEDYHHILRLKPTTSLTQCLNKFPSAPLPVIPVITLGPRDACASLAPDASNDKDIPVPVLG